MSVSERVWRAATLLALWVTLGCEAPPPQPTSLAPRFAAAAADLEQLIRHEMADKGIPGLSIAVLADDRIVWSAGFGSIDRESERPATAQTVYRVGSVSKLFTDVAAMQLVEAGALDLDAPITDVLPDFRPANPFGVAVTLRQLMSHRAGLVREPPVGHYFDPSEPALESTVDSLNATELVYEPGTRIKYSNAGLAVVGMAVERASGVPFEQYVCDHVIGPLGLADTCWRRRDAPAKRLAAGTMWTYDGRRFAAPTFDLGMAPAANLYASCVDLVRFARGCFAGGSRHGPAIVAEPTLLQMFEPQFAPAATAGIGLGFFVDQLDGHRRVGHNGAMYGFATELAALPDEGFAVAVVATLDFANSVPQRIADRALRWLLAEADGRQPEQFDVTRQLDDPGRYAGTYRDNHETMVLRHIGSELWADPPYGTRRRVQRRGDQMFLDDALGHGPGIELRDGAVQWRGRQFTAVPDARPDPPPQDWAELIGEYGWDHDTLFVLERDGRLAILIEWLELYPLTARDTDDFRLPDGGLYAGERVTFARRDGVVSGVVVGGVLFERRRNIDSGQTFRITPKFGQEELRRAALAADPPPEVGPFRRPDLLELSEVDPSFQLDIRYATTNNFMGMVFYPESRAFLQRPAAEALQRAHQRLEAHGYGLLIYDAYRPWFVTKMFYDATPDDLRGFVADPSHGSRHNRGCAVDVTMFDRSSGEPVEMLSGYDEFTARAYPEYPGGSSLQRWHRELLRKTLEAEGFTVYEHEWWHFDYRDWREYPIMNTPFR